MLGLALAVAGGPASGAAGPAQARIAFWGGPVGVSGQIWTVPTSGGASNTMLTNTPGNSRDPSWSPDGKRIAFHRTFNLVSDIWIMSGGGGGRVNLTDGTGDEAKLNFQQPDWSANGERLVVTALNGDVSKLVTMKSSGTDIKNVGTLVGKEPDWSPDGKRIAFDSNAIHPGGDSEIYIADPDGKNLVRVTDNNSDDLQPAWSPTGERLAFVSRRGGNYEIVLNPPAAGTGESALNVTKHPGDDLDPSWSPSGQHLVYTSVRPDSNGQETPNVFKLRLRTSESTNLTEAGPSKGLAKEPTWQPYSGCGNCFKVTAFAFDLSAARFQAAKSGASISRRAGTRVAYKLSRPAITTFRVARVAPGAREPALLRGRFRHRGDTGRNRFRFTGRLRGRRLAPGRYQLRAVVRDLAGNRGRRVRPVSFGIVR